MKKQTDVAIEAHIIRGASYLLLLVAGTVMTFFGAEAPTKVSHPAAAGRRVDKEAVWLFPLTARNSQSQC